MRRSKLKMSQEKLGRALGLSMHQVQKYEKGKNKIGAGRLHQIASTLRVPIAFFFEGAPTPYRKSDRLDPPSPTFVKKFLATSDGLALTKAFVRIKSPSVRRNIVRLVQRIVGAD